MQRVNLTVDGQRRNTKQSPTNPAFILRLTTAIRSAARVEVTRWIEAPPEPPQGHPLDGAGQAIVFFAQVTADSASAFLASPGHWQAAVTADPAYQSDEAHAFIKACLAAGRTVRPWCDCREPNGDPPGTPFTEALAMAQLFGLAEPIGQAESSAELEHALVHGARIIVGNPSALTKEEISRCTAMVNAGTLAFIGEEYRPDVGYSAQGIPIQSRIFGIALDAGAYYPLNDYLSVSPPGSDRTCCLYHGAGLRPVDWALLR